MMNFNIYSLIRLLISVCAALLVFIFIRGFVEPSLTCEIRTSDVSHSQVFYVLKKEFWSEKQSTRASVYTIDDWQKLSFQLTNRDIVKLRFDPITHDVPFQIRKLKYKPGFAFRWVDVDLNEVISVNVSIQLSEDSSFIATPTNEDPQFILMVDPPSEGIHFYLMQLLLSALTLIGLFFVLKFSLKDQHLKQFFTFFHVHQIIAVIRRAYGGSGLFVVVLLTLYFFVNSIGLDYGAPDFRSWAPDEIDPIDIIVANDYGFQNDWYKYYPPIHYYTLNVAHWIITDLIYDSEYDVARQDGIYHVCRMVYRWISAVQGGFCLLIFFYLCRMRHDHTISRILTLSMMFVYQFLYYTKFANVDIAYTLWILIAAVFYVHYLKSHQVIYHFLYLTFTVLSVGTKNQAYAIMFLPTIHMIGLSAYRHHQKTARNLFLSLFNLENILLYLWFLVLFAWAFDMYENMDGFIAHIHHLLGTGSVGYRNYEMTLFGQLQLARANIVTFVFMFGLPISGLFLWSNYKIFRSGNQSYLMILGVFVVYHLLFMGVVGFTAVRYFLPLSFLVLWVAGDTLSTLFQRYQSKWKQALILFVLLFPNLLLTGFMVYDFVSDSRYEVEAFLQDEMNSGKQIVMEGQIRFMPRLRSENVVIHDMWNINNHIDSADFVIINLETQKYYKGEEEYERLVTRLNDTDQFRLVYESDRSLFNTLNQFLRIDTSMFLINPRLKVYKKS